MITGRTRSRTRSHNHQDVSLSTSIQRQQQTALPLPKAIKGNRSFANLAKLFGVGTSYRDDPAEAGESAEDEDDEEEPGEGDETEDAVDEDSLMWDAQTALIAHQPSIAMQHYTIAALPPHRSAGACLALGNLLTRGSGLIRRESTSNEAPSIIAQSPNTQHESKSATTRFREYIFKSPPPSPAPDDLASQPVRPVAVGWGIPTDGKRAIRDAEGMGVAGGWLVLGLGWSVEEELAKTRNAQTDSDNDNLIDISSNATYSCGNDTPNIRSTPSTRASSRRGSISAQLSSVDLSHNSSDATESTVLKTPYDDDLIHVRSFGTGSRSEYDQLKLFYELMSPLVSLYRHGQIQAHDPVSLPPISSSQLPACLQPLGDHQKRRNAWNLGGVVMKAIHDLDILKGGSKGKGKAKESRKTEQLRTGVAVMTNYVLGMTRSEFESEAYFRQVVHLGQTGMEVVDELVRQAAARLDIILRSPPPTATPLSPNAVGEYPFPHIVPPSRPKQHSRMPSTASRASFMSTMSARLLPSKKSTASLASMKIDGENVVGHRTIPRFADQSTAVSSLRRIRASSTRPAEVHSQTWWPRIPVWSIFPNDADKQVNEDNTVFEEEEVEVASQTNQAELRSPPTNIGREKPISIDSPIRPPDINTIAPTPNLVADTTRSSGLSTPRRRLPFEPSESDSICTIDPELAAAELRSALTKHVVCGVCNAKGLNFPECPRCSLTFCSRSCRVDEKKAGNGKRHVCGAWESRKLLTVPTPAPRSRRKSSAARAQTVKA